MIKNYRKGERVSLSENFVSTEFDCKGKGCCSSTQIDSELVIKIQKIRSHFGKAVTVNSGYRCEGHNTAVGGAKGSRHMLGMAADIAVKGTVPVEVAKYAEHIGVLGIGLYGTFVHIDSRTKKGYWYSEKECYRSTFGGSNPYKYTGSLVKKGNRGTNVKWLQWELNFTGFNCGSVDGIFGVKTLESLLSFQKAYGLKVDGICGQETSKALKEW